MKTQENGQTGALALDAWLASVARTICHAVEQRSDDVNVEMQEHVIVALKRRGIGKMMAALQTVEDIDLAIKYHSERGDGHAVYSVDWPTINQKLNAVQVTMAMAMAMAPKGKAS